MDTVQSSMSFHRWSQSQKDANGKQWYKDRMGEILTKAFSNLNGYGGIDETKRMKVNYDLFNGIINKADFEYVCKPYGSEVGELPANFTNRDIISPKIRVLLGLEIKRPFSWKVVAVNEEATTRKEQEEFNRNKQFVISQIMAPIKAEAEQKYQQQATGQQLTQEQKAQIQKQIEDEVQAKTPDEVRKYMLREHQDPAEVLMNQLLRYEIQRLKVGNKFNKGWKHAQLSGQEYYRVWINGNGDPDAMVINPMYFDCDRSPEIEFVEDGEWAVYKHLMTPSQVAAVFPELKPDQIDEIYNRFPYASATDVNDWSFNGNNTPDSGNSVPVYHVEFKSLAKIGWLTYKDEQGQEQLTPVSEGYVVNQEAGDISIEWEYSPQRHEGYRVGHDIYLRMRPVPGQFIDIDKIGECKLSYKGVAYDNLNSSIVSSMDRGKPFQYFFNIINYRLENLIASDKGKKILMNLKMIPKSMGINIEKWLYYLDAANVAWYNPNEEGSRGDTSANSIAQSIDLSMASQINNYIQLLEYIDGRCGAAVGVPRQMEGQISSNDAVTNTKQTIVQSSHILEPMFEMHNIVKANVLSSLVDIAKVAYTIKKPKALAYVLDDLSTQLLNIDVDLLDASSYGLFVTNSTRANEIKEMIEQLAHAAIQNQAVELSDVIKVIKTDDVNDAEEELRVSEQTKAKRTMDNQLALEQSKQAEAEKVRAFEREKWAYDRGTKLAVQDKKGEDDLLKQTILSTGFNEDKDLDNDGTPDVLEIAKHGLNAKIHEDEISLEKDKLSQKTKNDNKQNELKQKELEIKSKQANKPNKSS